MLFLCHAAIIDKFLSFQCHVAAGGFYCTSEQGEMKYLLVLYIHDVRTSSSCIITSRERMENGQNIMSPE
jgi:hypothetical protein